METSDKPGTLSMATLPSLGTVVTSLHSETTFALIIPESEPDPTVLAQVNH